MKSIVATGKRKTAIARATLKQGTGKVTVNNIALEVYEPAMMRLKLQEPFLLAGAEADKVDVSINVIGGGFVSQVSAARLAVARAFVEKSAQLKEAFLAYDRQLLVADVRRKEVAKPNHHGKARATRQKSYR